MPRAGQNSIQAKKHLLACPQILLQIWSAKTFDYFFNKHSIFLYGCVLVWGNRIKPARAARQVFSAMREVDVEAVGEDELGVCHQFALLHMAEVQYSACVPV
jgi:hypothetical protein